MVGNANLECALKRHNFCEFFFQLLVYFLHRQDAAVVCVPTDDSAGGVVCGDT